MQSQKLQLITFTIVILALIISGCSQSTEPIQPTETQQPTPTKTAVPSKTPRPSPTPDVAATQQREAFVVQVENYKETGYINSSKGEYFILDDFAIDWAQLDWFQLWPVNRTAGNLVFNAHFFWSTASDTPSLSGCGLAFAIQPNGDYFVVFLDKSRILFLILNSSQGNYAWEVGKTRGTGRVKFGNPAEADFTLTVQDHKATVLVNDEFIGEYTLLKDAKIEGEVAYSVLSGTNKDYGTRCEITDARLWKIK